MRMLADCKLPAKYRGSAMRLMAGAWQLRPDMALEAENTTS